MDIESHPRMDCTPRQVLFGRCAMEKCNQPPLHGIPLCEAHGAAVALYMQDHAESIERAAEIKHQREEEELYRFRQRHAEKIRKLNSTFKTDPGLIYYLRVGDKIKIGFTTDLEQRLRAYPPFAVLLATHPGTVKLEGQMHAKFCAHLIGGREWFAVSDQIMQHIENVRKEFKQDRRVTA